MNEAVRICDRIKQLSYFMHEALSHRRCSLSDDKLLNRFFFFNTAIIEKLMDFEKLMVLSEIIEIQH